MNGDSTRTDRWSLAGWTIALAFLLAGLVTLPDRGLTWDEPESLLAGAGNLEIVRTVLSGGGAIEWPWHELKGHQFVVDTLRVLFARAVGPLVGGPEIAGVPIRGAHLFHLLLTTAALLLVFHLAWRISGSARIGALAALALALLPKLVAHSQNNPKDLIALVLYALFLSVLEWAIGRSGVAERDEPTRWPFAVAGAVLGLAFANHVLSALLVPIGGLWLLSRIGTRWRQLLGTALYLGCFSGLATLLCWPWLWTDPIVRAARAARRVIAFPLEMEVLHLGRLYPAAELPREYFLIHLLAATPLFVLAAAGLGAVFGLRRTGDGEARIGRTGRRDLAVLALLWLGLPVVVEAFTSARYDGVRHLLCVLPALAILAALGIDALAEAARDRRRWAAALLALMAAGAVWTGVDLVRYHPYQDAYLNAATRRAVGLSGERPEELFELEYWGAAYKEGAEWVRGEAGGEETRVFVPFGAWCAAPYAGPEVTVMGDLWLDGLAEDLGVIELSGYSPDLRPAPDYLMLIPRRSFLGPDIERIRTRLEPVHAVRRFGATLLEIYELPAPGEG